MLTVPGLIALAASGSGNVAVLAVAASEGTQLAPWVQGGGSAAAVAGLVYVARMIVRGELVPRPVKDSENNLRADIESHGQREAKLMAVSEACVSEARAAREQHDRALVILATTDRALQDVAQEMQYWREMRDRGTRREERGPLHREDEG